MVVGSFLGPPGSAFKSEDCRSESARGAPTFRPASELGSRAHFDTQSPSSIPLALKDLFDFNIDYWQSSSEVAGTRGLQDELEFYELLDLDASGEQDTDIAVDSMSEAVLMST